jgi:hypothetical protein
MRRPSTGNGVRRSAADDAQIKMLHVLIVPGDGNDDQVSARRSMAPCCVDHGHWSMDA